MDAIGGLDNWRKITSWKLTCYEIAGGNELLVTTVVVTGKAQRTDITMSGKTAYTINTTKEGWYYDPFSGDAKVHAASAEDIKESQDGLDMLGPLVDYKTKGNKITYLGMDNVDSTDCYKLKVDYPSGEDEIMYIDATTYYNIRSVGKVKYDDKEIERTTNFSKFQKLPEGIVISMYIDGGNQGAMTVKKVEINIPVDESIFKPNEVADDKK